VLAAGWAIPASLALRAGNRTGAAVTVFLSLVTGALAALPGAHPAASPLKRALNPVLLVLGECLLYAAAGWWVRVYRDAAGPLAVAFLAAAGALLLGYARTRIRASAGLDLPDGPLGLAGREVRLLVLLLGIATGQVYAALIVCAALAHAAVLLHLVRLRGALTG
jgi:hypothetical protein